jgi:hypothetical protein
MAMFIKRGGIMIGFQTIPERKKPVLGIMEGNQFVVYGQLHDEKSAVEFMNKLVDFLCVERGAEDGTENH